MEAILEADKKVREAADKARKAQERVEKLTHPALGSGGHDIIAKYSDRGMMDSMPKKKFVFKKKEPVAEPKEPVAKPKKSTSSIIDNLQTLVGEMNEASKEGGKFKRRENWKGKAGYEKKINKLWEEYQKTSGGADTFYGKLPPGFNLKQKSNTESHASRMHQKHGTNID